MLAQGIAHIARESRLPRCYPDERCAAPRVIHFAYFDNDARIIKFEKRPATGRVRGIPYMNEFRSVKQRDAALETSNFMLQSPAAIRVPQAVRLQLSRCGRRPGLRYATAVAGSRLCIYFLGKTPLQCNISAVLAPSLNSTKTSVNVFKEA